MSTETLRLVACRKHGGPLFACMKCKGATVGRDPSSDRKPGLPRALAMLVAFAFAAFAFAACGIFATQKQELKDTAAIGAIVVECKNAEKAAASGGAGALDAVKARCNAELNAIDDAGAP